MRVEETIGQRIRARREMLELSQSQLGRYVGELLGREWPRQAVSAAERGKRSFTAAELVAFAFSLKTSVSRLLTPLAGVDVVELADDGPRLPRDDVLAAVLPRLTTASALDDMHDTLGRLRSNLAAVMDGAGLAADDVQLLSEQFLTASRIASATRVSQSTGEITDYDPELGEWVRRSDQQADRPIPVEEALEQPVATAIVTSDLGVLVGRRNDGKPPWTFIAGEVEPGESPADAAVREVKEETGLRVQLAEVIGERVHPKTGRTMIYIAATPTHGTDVFVGDEDELAEVRWVSLAEADELMAAYGIYGPVHEYLQRELSE